MPTYQNDPVNSTVADGSAILGESTTWHAIYGKSTSKTGGYGVMGEAEGTGVAGVSHTWIGVYGETSGDVAGVCGDGKVTGDGVRGTTKAAGKAGVSALQVGNNGPGIYAEGTPAGEFKGNVHVTGALNQDGAYNLKGDMHLIGDLTHDGACKLNGDVRVAGDMFLDGADYAEALTAATEVLAGMVVVLDDDGRITPCSIDYDDRVAGVVAGARGVRSALVLDRHDGGAPVALAGKVWVNADATAAPIRCGDTLTTSATPGHARRVTERDRAFGAVIGKALTDLPAGRGMVRILVG